MENRDDYLIRYKILTQERPPSTPPHIVSLKSRRSLCKERDRESYLCDIVEGVASTLHSLNILLLQQGINGL